MAKKNKEEEAYKQFFNNFVEQPNQKITPKPLLPSNNPEPKMESSLPKAKEERTKSIPKHNVILNHNNSMMYEDVKIHTLPLGEFYKTGTRIQFRDLKVKEIEHFSTLDESSEQDFIDKLNDILENCILFTHSDGTIGSYLDVKEGDRPWLIYMIREKTFPQGKVLSIKVPYVKDGVKIDVDLEFKRENIEIYRGEEIMNYLDPVSKTLVIETDFRTYEIAPPTIGLKKCFDHYLKLRMEEFKDLPENELRDKINSKFIIMAPYLKPNVTFMEYDDILKFQEWFETTISPEEYSFLYDLFRNYLKIGIAGLKKKVDTEEVRYNKVYPNRRTSLFLLPNAFKLYLRDKTKS